MPPSGGGLSFHVPPFPRLTPPGYDMSPSGEGSNSKTGFRQTPGLGELPPTAGPPCFTGREKGRGAPPALSAGGAPLKNRTGGELLSRTLECSIIAAEALHARVRDGNGCFVLAMATSPERVAAQEAVAFSGTVSRMALERPRLRAAPLWARRCFVFRTSPEPAVPFGSARIGGSRGQASRRISTGRLNALPRLHLPPIDPVVFRAPSGSFRSGRTRLRGGLALRCLQRLSFRDIATRRCRWRDNRNTRGRSLPVLSY